MVGLQQSLPSLSMAIALSRRSAKEAAEEQRLWRAIEEAERRMLFLKLGRPAGFDVIMGKVADEANKSDKEKHNQKGGNTSSSGKEGRYRSASSFLRRKEPVLR